MLLACHKKSYHEFRNLKSAVVCPVCLCHFFKTNKTDTGKQGRQQLISNFKFQTSRFKIAFLMTCQQHNTIFCLVFRKTAISSACLSLNLLGQKKNLRIFAETQLHHLLHTHKNVWTRQLNNGQFVMRQSLSIGQV